MSTSNPIQTAFNAGEISDRLRGRFGSPVYERGLDFCENLMPTPHGSIIMRAGSKDVRQEDILRLVAFFVADGDPYTIVFSSGKVKIRDSNGDPVLFAPPSANKITNGSFFGDLSSWTPTNASWNSGGYAHVGIADPMASGSIVQDIALTDGVPYKLRFKAWRAVNAGKVRVRLGATIVQWDVDVTSQPTVYEIDFVGTAAMAATTISFITYTGGLGVYQAFDVDDISIVDTTAAPTDELASPWTDAQIPAVQVDQDITKNRMAFCHGNVETQLLSRDSSGLFRLDPFQFSVIDGFDSKPSIWQGTNWPACLDWGFQGRLWFGGTPSEPNIFKGSVSGEPFNFKTGANAADSVSFNASVRGALKWIQGQKALLLGAEYVEQAAHGSNSIIMPTNVQVEEESAFGSAAIQAIHVGDEMIYISRNKKIVRALSYDAQVKAGWVSKSLSFTAEHLFNSTIKEMHFIRLPDPVLIFIFTSKVMVACTYDRMQGVAAWWRLGPGNVISAAVGETIEGSDLRIAVERADGIHFEILHFHEAGIDYLDSWQSVVADAGGAMAGLDRFDGQTISVKYQDDEGHTVVGSVEVAGGSATLEDAAGQTVVVGIPFTATARTLPLALKDKKGRYSKIGVLLNRSALPTINGYLPQNDKLAEDPQGLPQALRTGKFSASNEGTDDEAKITLTQDLPFRTEILALFGIAEV